jgi:tetratricopeptide (TPR) repeat protein
LESVAEGWQALRLFTNRHAEICRFVSALQGEPPPRIWFLHGDGGNGKSLLLKILQQRYAKRFQSGEWAALRELSAGEVAERVAADERNPMPVALLNFAASMTEYERPQEPFSALLTLRRQLMPHGLRFATFDFAAIWYLHRTGAVPQSQLQVAFPSDEMGVLGALMDVVSHTSWGTLAGAALNLFGKKYGGGFRLWAKRRALDEQMLAAILRLDPHSQLVAELPRLFAADLAASMRSEGAPARAVLLFDTHDAFWPERRNLSTDLFFERDEWLRALVSELDLAAGIVVAIAGREPPRWAEAPRTRVPAERIEPWHVGPLSADDADRYLQHAGVDDPAIRAAVVSVTAVVAGQVHPLFLALTTDVVLRAGRRGDTNIAAAIRQLARGEGETAQVVTRLLRYADPELDDAVRALAACRSFDREIYFLLSDALRFAGTRAGFRLLTGMSFVWRDENSAQFRVHDLLRRLFRDSADELVTESDEVLERHYFARYDGNNASALSEGLYHANQRDWQRGIRRWQEEVEHAVESNRNAFAEAMTSIVPELVIRGAYEKGRTSRLVGDVNAAFSRYRQSDDAYRAAVRELRQARKEGTSAAVEIELANALMKWGDTYHERSVEARAAALYRRARETAERALALEPANGLALTTLSYILLSQGDVCAARAEHAAAEELYRLALAKSDEALPHSPDPMEPLVNGGYAHASLADIYAARARWDEAAAELRQAIDRYDRAAAALGRVGTPTVNKLWSLSTLATVSMARRDRAAAEAAIAEVERIWSELTEDDVYIANNVAHALITYVELLTEADDAERASAMSRRALQIVRDAMQVAPSDPRLRVNEIAAIHGLADSRNAAGDVDAAETLFRDVVVKAEALLAASDDTAGLAHRGSALGSLAEIRHGRGFAREAAELCAEALASFDAWAEVAPEDVDLLSERSRVRGVYGGILHDLGRLDEGLLQVDAALADVAHVRELGYEEVTVVRNESYALVTRGEIELALSHLPEAVEALRAGIAVCRAGLENEPGDPVLIANAWAATGTLTDALLQAGDLAGARQAVEAARDLATPPDAEVLLAEVEIEGGAARSAARRLTSAIRALRGGERALEESEARRQLAEALLELGHAGLAARQAEASLALARGAAAGGERLNANVFALQSIAVLAEAGAVTDEMLAAAEALRADVPGEPRVVEAIARLRQSAQPSRA